MITIEYDDQGLATRLQGLQQRLKRPGALYAVLGREVANRLKKHFLGKDRTEPNQLAGYGSKREHFWRQVSMSVQSPVINESGGTVRVSINHPVIAQKVFGGTIRAKRSRYLTIPVVPEAYGRAASVFERETGMELHFIRMRGMALLVTKGEGKAGIGRVQYVLKTQVTQRPDPTALPPQAEMESAILARAEAMVARETKTV